jgi:hypothetical protein
MSTTSILQIIFLKKYFILNFYQYSPYLQRWQIFSLQPFLGTQPVGPPDALCFGLLLASDWAVPAIPFAFSFLLCFSTMTCSMASRSGSSVRVDSGTVEWLRLYWFCHNIGTDASTISARSALPKGIFPFFVVGTALGLSFNVGRCLTWSLNTPICKICCCTVALWGLRTAC